MRSRGERTGGGASEKAVQFGAGNIGRGFIGQLFSRSGYEVVFAEVDARIVEAMNASRRYPVRVVSDAGDSETFVENVRAVNGATSPPSLARSRTPRSSGRRSAPARCRRIAPALAAGLSLRWRTGIMAPLNVILCENLVDADEAFRGHGRREAPAATIGIG